MRGPLALLARSPQEDLSRDGEPRFTWTEILILALTVLVARMLAARAFPIYDDAFITYRYARNLATGLGLVYNPGASWEPILGTTTPGYAVLLAGFQLLGLPIVAGSLALNFLCDALSAVLLIQLLDRRVVSSLVAVVAFAAIPEIARISAGGMEPPVVVVCALAAVRCFQLNRMFLSGLASAIACTLRPECVLLVLTLGVLALIERRSLLPFLLPVIVIGALFAGTLQWIYGSPFSHSVVAKAATHSGEQKPGFSRLPDILAQAFGPSQPMRMLAVMVGIGAIAMWFRRSKFLPFAIFAALIVVAYLIARPKTWGWYFYAPLLAWVAWLGMGFEQFARWIGFDRLGLGRQSRVRVATIAACVLCLGAVSAFPLVRADKVTPMVYGHFETWAKEARLAERKVSISASDIGAIGWYTDALIYDSAGLVWPEAMQLTRPVDQIRKYMPDYVILVVRRSRLEPFHAGSPSLAARYRPIRRFNEFNKTGLDKLHPHISELPDWWEQDYLIYERIDERDE